MSNGKKTTPGEFQLLTEHCVGRDRLLSVVDQLATQRKQITITHDKDNEWNVTYTSGPSFKGEF